MAVVRTVAAALVTKAARKIVEAGGSLRDVQQLAGHRSLQTTQGYIDENPQAKAPRC